MPEQNDHLHENVLDSALYEALAEHLVETGRELSSEELDSILEHVMGTVPPELASDLLVTLKSTAPAMLQDRRDIREGFEARLCELWGKAIDLLEMLREMATETGEMFNAQERSHAVTERDFVFGALVRLHARACQVAGEVLALLRTGYASGAYSRWRTLHELAATAAFIAKHGNDTAERYLLHDWIAREKAGREYQKHCETLGYEPLGKEELAELARARDELCQRFGEPFADDYGWASSALKDKRPTFSRVERDAEFEHMRPLYRLASYGVHANARCVTFNLGCSFMTDKEILPAGPSNAGLVEPGHSTAISLIQATTTLLARRPNVERVVTMMAMQKLEEEIEEAFVEADEELRRRIEAQEHEEETEGNSPKG